MHVTQLSTIVLQIGGPFIAVLDKHIRLMFSSPRLTNVMLQLSTATQTLRLLLAVSYPLLPSLTPQTLFCSV